ncbi:MAG: GNAT family N-acetyltransferase [Methanotrichaceae archaeon]|nr:GNAT family N-acetyltransferase [Methanotrichaceae archaeon]
MLIKKATIDDLEGIKLLADKNRNELGFVLNSALVRSINRGELIIALDETIVGFLEYHHRKDCQTTIYHFVIEENYRLRGISKILLNFLIRECESQGMRYVFLKCPADLNANNIYPKLGFKNVGLEGGKKRKLNLWNLNIYLS